MCFDHDSTPPLPTLRGAAVDSRLLTLTASDGNHFAAHEARGDGSGGAAVLVLPDVRGLYSFYGNLADRFAERGYDSLAIDYFGRTAGVGTRDETFDYMPHVRQTTHDGVRADATAGLQHLKSLAEVPVFTIGFCFGGSNSWHQAANGLGLAGAIGFYGHPDREFPPGSTSLLGRVGEMACPILALMAGDDAGIPVELADRFRDALTAAGVPNDVVVYPGAPHSFFDRKYEQFASESADAWNRVMAFIAAHK